MITPWKVLECVAQRYGDRQASIEQAHEKLLVMREQKINPVRMEENEDRILLRLARENSPDIGLERIIGTVDFQDVYILKVLAQLSKSVCRLTKGSNAIGTGFLISDDIIITNHHVISRPSDAADMYAEFDYELSPPPNSTIQGKSVFRLNPSAFFLTSSLAKDPEVVDSGLDFTIIALEKEPVTGKQLSEFPSIKLDGNLGKIVKGESCIVIQHPAGKPKKVVLKNAGFFSETDSRIIYETDTLPGSSGSMVVALGTCEVIALHHAGLPRTDERNRILTKDGSLANPSTPEEEIDWIGNEGIKVSRIVGALKSSSLSAEMEKKKIALLRNTNTQEKKLNEKMDNNSGLQIIRDLPGPDVKNMAPFKASEAKADFLLTAVNNPATLKAIEAIFKSRYGDTYSFYLAMPSAALENHIELFVLQARVKNLVEEVQALMQMPGILNAEADIPLALNTGQSFEPAGSPRPSEAESLDIISDEFGEENEPHFLELYQDKSPYVKALAKDYRMWNWAATNFKSVAENLSVIAAREKGIRIVQFDTGYTDHKKVKGGFDLDNDFDFLDSGIEADDAADERKRGILRQPMHGTRTGSLIIGCESNLVNDGNLGLLTGDNFKITPYRISQSVILINRQRQLAAAVDRAMSQGFDIITMSMGLPPTIATAKMAKRVYDKGIIWCCAAGNEVQFVIAPAVYPGSIAVAASNPLDKDWPKSSRGDTVDITAPGQDVYVPILFKDPLDGFAIKEGFAYGSGTSYATPHVAAAAALWLAQYKTILDEPAYQGWKRVEAFRKALSKSARTCPALPGGFGPGILDVEKLLKTEPDVVEESDYAYNKWNENAFFATLQGYAELAKTYWNRIHGWFSGRRRGEESMIEETELSTLARQFESGLFGTSYSTTESATSEGETSRRLNKIQQQILRSAKQD